MFKYLIKVTPLGLMYGSSGAFLSPENLVGRSGKKFPPEAATLSGLFFSVNKASPFAEHQQLRNELYVTGPFWASQEDPEDFYVPVPWHKVIGEENDDEWYINSHKWSRDEQKKDLEPDYRWQTISAWKRNSRLTRRNQEAAKVPWEYISFLHPKIKVEERHVESEDGLFLENAVQMQEGYCLVYLSTHKLPDGWYRFGGEGHMVELECQTLDADSEINQLLREPIGRSCALITPGVWGSNKVSHRYPQHASFPKDQIKMLTDKPVPYRYRAGSRLSRGRYAVPAGSIYVFKYPLDERLNTWWKFPDEWFPKEGFRLKQVGCGLCLPINLQIDQQGVA